MKICYKCKIEKDESEFYKAPRNKDGLVSYCKSCHRVLYGAAAVIRTRNWRRENPESAKKLNKNTYLQNKDKPGYKERVVIHDKNYKLRHKEKLKLIQSNRNKNRSMTLHDSYLRRQLNKIGVPYNVIDETPIIVQAFREITINKRLCKTLMTS